MVSRPDGYTATVGGMLQQFEGFVEDLKTLPLDTPVNHYWFDFHPRSQVVRERVLQYCAEAGTEPLLSFPVQMEDGTIKVFTFMVPASAVLPEEGEQT